MNCINGINLPIWLKELYEKISQYTRKPIIQYNMERDDVDWKKISTLSTNPKIFESDIENFKYIKQGKISDCSLISAIISVCNYEKNFEKRSLKAIIFPQKENNAMVNKYGTYGIRLYLNGSFRYFEIDDTIPFSKSTQKPLLSSTESPDEFWLQLIEKSITLLYDFKKVQTNPSYEIYHLCGW